MVNKLPNPPELVLLKTLWEKGSLPVKPLHDFCAHDLGWSFSSTRKTMERMEAKGLVCLDQKQSPLRYSAAVSKTATLAGMTRDFFTRVLEINEGATADIFTNSPLLTDDDLDELDGLL